MKQDVKNIFFLILVTYTFTPHRKNCFKTPPVIARILCADTFKIIDGKVGKLCRAGALFDLFSEIAFIIVFLVILYAHFEVKAVAIERTKQESVRDNAGVWVNIAFIWQNKRNVSCMK